MDKRIQSLSQFFHFPLKHGDSVESLMLLSAVNSAHRAPQVQSCVCMTRPEDRKAGLRWLPLWWLGQGQAPGGPARAGWRDEWAAPTAARDRRPSRECLPFSSCSPTLQMGAGVDSRG